MVPLPPMLWNFHTSWGFFLNLMCPKMSWQRGCLRRPVSTEVKYQISLFFCDRELFWVPLRCSFSTTADGLGCYKCLLPLLGLLQAVLSIATQMIFLKCRYDLVISLLNAFTGSPLPVGLISTPLAEHLSISLSFFTEAFLRPHGQLLISTTS